MEGESPDDAVDALRQIGAIPERAERLSQIKNHWILHFPTSATPTLARAYHATLHAHGRRGFASLVYKVAGTTDEVVPVDRVVVKFKGSTKERQIDSLTKSLGLSLVRPPRPDSGFNYHVFSYPPDSAFPLRVAAQLDRHPLIEWADPDKISSRRLDGTPSDPFYGDQYYLKSTLLKNGISVDDNVEPAWAITTGGLSAATGGNRVAVIGTGIDASHPDFGGKVISGYDAMSCSGCTDNETRPFPSVSDAHGTEVTGLILGQHDGAGMAGIAPGVVVIATRIARNGFFATDQGIADAINFTWHWKSAYIINNSWGGGSPSNAITSAIQAANSQGRGGKGTLVVFSAGNTSNRIAGTIGHVAYPATLPEVVAVGAISKYGELTNYSPEGSELDIVAPSGQFTAICSSGDVVTTDIVGSSGCNGGPGGSNSYVNDFSGTSAAAPQVAAVAALVLAHSPSMTAADIKAKLYSGADPWGTSTKFGRGKLNAFRSVSNVVVSVTGITTVKTAGNYTWTASATGGTGSYAFQWERSIDNGPYGVVKNGSSYAMYMDSNVGTTIDLRVTAVSGVETGVANHRVNNLILP